MQQVLSMETSRRGHRASDAEILGGEFITKRLCCSVVLTVAFLGFLGGFLLGRFIPERATIQMHADFIDISKKVSTLNKNLQETFPLELNQSLPQCSQTVILKCNFTQIGKNDSGQLLAVDYLRTLNACLGDG
ncbi:hypothetical protein NQ317_004719 [Molorchus minor]|uniref:Uncharacterized protein n=1 Tax=Molorchus minor TaxID=1323400 RepID=A0ABQ9JQU0_9CUCU|nr:hypothetical protein NQ317_004719 [Molorchus minor]